MKISKQQLKKLITEILEMNHLGSEALAGNIGTHSVRAGDTLSGVHAEKGDPSKTLQDQIDLNKSKNPEFKENELGIDQVIYLYLDPMRDGDESFQGEGTPAPIEKVDPNFIPPEASIDDDMEDYFA